MISTASGTLGYENLGLVVLALVLAEIYFKSVSENILSFGFAAKTLSMSALIDEKDVDGGVAGYYEVLESRLARSLKRFKYTNLEKYYSYEVTGGDQEERRTAIAKQIYGHSCFFSWRLWQIYRWWIGFIIIVVIIVGWHSAGLLLNNKFEAFHLVANLSVYILILGNLLTLLLKANGNVEEFGRIANSLRGAVDASEVTRLVEDYARRRIRSSEIPSLLFEFHNAGLESDWELWRQK